MFLHFSTSVSTFNILSTISWTSPDLDDAVLNTILCVFSKSYRRHRSASNMSPVSLLFDIFFRFRFLFLFASAFLARLGVRVVSNSW